MEFERLLNTSEVSMNLKLKGLRKGVRLIDMQVQFLAVCSWRLI